MNGDNSEKQMHLTSCEASGGENPMDNCIGAMWAIVQCIGKELLQGYKTTMSA